MIRKLDLPAKAPLSSSAQAKEPGRPDANANLYRLAAQQRDGSEDLARVFYVSPAVSVRGIQEIITAMRKDARIQKVFRIPRRPQSLCAEIQPNSPRHHAVADRRFRPVGTRRSFGIQLVLNDPIECAPCYSGFWSLIWIFRDSYSSPLLLASVTPFRAGPRGAY